MSKEIWVKKISGYLGNTRKIKMAAGLRAQFYESGRDSVLLDNVKNKPREAYCNSI